jgi:xanthine dehydrogenase YagR molybdenum-binding subunit
MTMNAAAPQPKENMGAPAPRYDARLKVTGEARYPADVPMTNPAFAFLVTSSIAKGSLQSLDLAEARAVPGVIDILTQDDASVLHGGKFGHGAATSIDKLGPEIAHDGQIIALVLADSYEAAREAAYKVHANYVPAPASATFGSDGLKVEDATKVSAQLRELPNKGDAEAALAAADAVIDAEYGTPTQHHNPLELFTTTCVWEGDRLTIYEPSQFVYGLKNGVAQRLGMDANNVRAVSHFAGGAFGSKGTMTPRTALIALAARKLNRPVKLVPTRDQGFTIATYRAETHHRVRLGARRDGKFVAYSHEGWEVSSRPDPYVVAGVKDSAHLYGFGAVATKVNIVHADRNTPGFMRSPPVVPYIFALESAVDELAIKLAMDPVELRRVNDTMVDSVTGKRWSSRSLMKCYDQAAEAFGWKQRDPRPGSMRDGDWLIGWGCATAVYPTHIGAATARVRLRSDGSVRVQSAAHEIGNGVYTVLAQLAAERLGVPLASVTVEVGDTNVPPAPVAGGSKTTASTCSAVLKACDAIRDRLFRVASTANDGPLAGYLITEIDLRDGRLATLHDGKSEPLADVFKRAGVSTIEEYAEFVPPGVKPEAVADLYKGNSAQIGGAEGEYIMYALGAEFVEVRVHALTREIRVPRIVGAFAGGRLMNTRTARSQYVGGMVWGISSALHEATEIDRERARYVNDNFADYLVPVNADIQQLDVILVPEHDDLVNPAGVKGIGELANVGTAAAVANAVYHATGIRIRELPIRLEKLLT